MIEIKIKVTGDTIAEAVTELVKAVGEQNDELKSLLAAANPAPVPEEDNDKGITIDEVRAVLMTCRDRGVNHKDLVQFFGSDLVGVKKTDYPKLMDLALRELEKLDNAKPDPMPEVPAEETEAPFAINETPEVPAEEEPEEEPVKPPKREEVRAMLAKARDAGHDIKAMMANYGASNLSGVKESDYADLLQDAKEALGLGEDE